MSSSNEDLTRAKKAPLAPPRAALARFASDSANQQRVQVNVSRVSNFIDEPLTDELFSTYHKRESKSNKSTVPGVNDYAHVEFKSMLRAQQNPEFSKFLGDRSRFGDGDGSFFDLWLNCDLGRNGRLKYDSFNLPLMK